jgi:hypothetical protein
MKYQLWVLILIVMIGFAGEARADCAFDEYLDASN